MKSRELLKVLQKDGWYLKRTSGSHQIFKHPTKLGTVVFAAHGGRDVPEGTLKAS